MKLSINNAFDPKLHTNSTVVVFPFHRDIDGVDRQRGIDKVDGNFYQWQGCQKQEVRRFMVRMRI